YAIAPYMTPVKPDPYTAAGIASNVLTAVNDPAWYNQIVAHKDLLAAFSSSLRLVCYEGGHHAGGKFSWGAAELEASLALPDMVEAYERCLELAEQAGVDLLCFFNMGQKQANGEAF